jgi:hypothetical protein
MACADNGAENRPIRRSCPTCGRELASSWQDGGAAHEPQAAFCRQCAARLRKGAAAAMPALWAGMQARVGVLAGEAQPTLADGIAPPR